jgi:hypothetical protein
VQPIALPAAFQRFREIGGVLEFAVFEGVQGDRESALDAICAVLPDADKNKLRALGYRCLDDSTFHGDWYDHQNRSLLRIGSYSTSDGRTLTDPPLVDLENVKITHGGGPIPEPGEGGQFAYAFSWTPYGLQARPTKIQALFDAIRDFIMPPNLEHEILDWTNPKLPEVSAFFAAGMEWWGVFLFTVHVPETGLLTVICGSTTD